MSASGGLWFDLRQSVPKCTTRSAKDMNSCTSRSLPREKTDVPVLSERVFTPSGSRSCPMSSVITLTKELERATMGLDRHYQAVEQGALSVDDTLRTRTQKLKARRSELLTEMAKLKNRQARVA